MRGRGRDEECKMAKLMKSENWGLAELQRSTSQRPLDYQTLIPSSMQHERTETVTVACGRRML
jgi:hypothetical protein